MKVQDITIYATTGAAIEYTVIAHNGIEFEDELCAALEEGCVLLDTVVGNKVIINPLTAVAVEIAAVREV